MGSQARESCIVGGLGRGTPSPHVFLLAMEPLHRLIKNVQDLVLLSPLSKGCETYRSSIYADAVVIFISPKQKEFNTIRCILQIFVEASGLQTNMDKTEFFPIQCDNTDLTFLSNANLTISSFPCKYLGLPLHFKKPLRQMTQLIIQKVINRMPGWQNEYLTYPGRELLIKSVLSAIPTYFMIAFKMLKWAYNRIDKFKRAFLLKERDNGRISGGHCLVNWQICQRPRKWGGLGIKDLEKFNRALRLH
jgi:hypothetical protein